MLDDTVPYSDPLNSQPEAPAQTPEVIQETPQEPPPPAGDSEKAEKYLNQLVDLVNQNKLQVSHTDLNKFDISSIQDHYRMDLGEYEVEINHSKQPETGQDFYVMLFNNIKKIEGQGENCINKIILAYTHLTQSQFENFKEAADAQVERKRREEELKRFSTAMSPIDDLLGNLGNTQKEETLEPKIEEPENEPVNEEPEELSNFNEEPKASDYSA